MMKKPVIIGIAGGSASGKTSIAHTLYNTFEKTNSVVIIKEVIVIIILGLTADTIHKLRENTHVIYSWILKIIYYYHQFKGICQPFFGNNRKGPHPL